MSRISDLERKVHELEKSSVQFELKDGYLYFTKLEHGFFGDMEWATYRVKLEKKFEKVTREEQWENPQDRTKREIDERYAELKAALTPKKGSK